MMEFFVSESILEVGLGGFGFDNRSLPVLNESAQPVIGCNRAARHHEIGRQTDLLDDDQLLVFLLQQEDEKLAVVQQIGLSPDFMMSRGSIATDDGLRALIQDGKAAVIKTKTAEPDFQDALRNEKFHHVVMVPVRGKKSVIGVLALGSRHWRSYTPEDLEFLETSANQLGIAVENVRLMEQVLRSQRQWINTFDSIQDLILVHDADFKIMKVNQALVGRL